ncbi:MAG: hypothetical protein SPL35_06190 [Bacteroidales bacterium]|nr:hypothetical protein [Bacteroidales bacterium]
MKKFILSIFALAALSTVLPAQNETPAKFKLYGFIRNYAIFDSREVKAGTEDLYFYMPKDEDMIGNDIDNNANASFRFLSLTTRLGLDVSGYQYGSMKLSGKVEADFYTKSGSTAILRLRQAYIGLTWDNLGRSGEDSFLLNIGQTWHPMAADMPHIVNLETGAPFNPFNRSPQLMANYNFGKKVTLTGGIIYGMQYLPVGPTSNTNLAVTKSADFMKYGLIPEVYAGVTFKPVSSFTAKIGANLFSIKPRRKDERGSLSDRLTTVSPFVFLQYTGKNGFQIRAKSILAHAGEHMNLLTGYGVSHINADGSWEYTPMRSTASFISMQYGKKWQVMGMAGYMRLLGTAEDLVDTDHYWFNNSGEKNIRQMFRLTPTIAYNLGKLTLALEYNVTGVQFGSAMDQSGLVQNDLHWVLNHRILTMAKFTF